MIRTDNLRLALNNVKIGDIIITKCGRVFEQRGSIVESCGKYNVWFEAEFEDYGGYYGDEDWHDDLKEMIEDYWKTWSEYGDSIEIELY